MKIMAKNWDWKFENGEEIGCKFWKRPKIEQNVKKISKRKLQTLSTGKKWSKSVVIFKICRQFLAHFQIVSPNFLPAWSWRSWHHAIVWFASNIAGRAGRPRKEQRARGGKRNEPAHTWWAGKCCSWGWSESPPHRVNWLYTSGNEQLQQRAEIIVAWKVGVDEISVSKFRFLHQTAAVRKQELCASKSCVPTQRSQISAWVCSSALPCTLD